jgi:S1-C subfamily serine protease
VVTHVNSGTPGAAAGLRAGSERRELLGEQFIRGGDVIVAINGQPVRSAADVVRIVTEELSPGQSVPMTYIRDGRRHRVVVKLAERPSNPG